MRNSGAIAIVEGVGDHGCEYMTGGLAIVLGAIGYNFAAGMTGGLAYVYDEDGTAGRRINRQLVNVEPLTTFEIDYVQQWIQHHFTLTNSPQAEAILNDWANQSSQVPEGRAQGSGGADPTDRHSALDGQYVRQ